jgi:TolB-like protein
VVFDLKNGIPKPDSAWYSIALSDLLIAALSKRPALDVPPRDTLLWTLKQMELGGQASEDHRRVLTGELGARAYLSGSYYAQRGRIRLTLAGYTLPENSPLFPEISVERSEDDLFALVDQAAGEVAKALLGEAPPPTEPPALAAAELKQPRNAREQDKDAAAREEKKKLQAERPAASAPAGGTPPAPPSTAVKPEALKTLDTPAAGEELGEVDGQRRKLQAGQLREKAATTAGLPRAEWAHAWYANRKALESCGLKKDDFEAAAATLSREFRKKAPEQGGWAASMLNDRTNAAKAASPADGALKAGPAIEFVCPGCEGVRPTFERCEPCDLFLIVRLKR